MTPQGRKRTLRTPPGGVQRDVFFNPDGASAVDAPRAAATRSRSRRMQPVMPVRVKIVHGNLAYATHPVVVGHYAGDTMVSAEQYIDKKLCGALSLRAQLGHYPGPVGTSAFIVNERLREDPGAKPQGAAIVGLGTPINLTASMLLRAFTGAMIEYVSGWKQNRHLLGGLSAANPDSIGVTTLLIGTGAACVSLSDAVYAVLNGVLAANREFENAKQPERIRHVEIVEVWEDVAIEAARCLVRLRQNPEINNRFEFDGKLLSGKGGMQRVSYEEAPEWWQRLQVLGGDDKNGDSGVLLFTATTQRARSEVRLLPTQRLLVDRFIDEAIRTPSNDQSVSRTLFELLLPNEIKEQAPDQDDLIFLLDEASARYPWELLEDPKCSSGPFVVRHGLIRQLASSLFREGVKNVRSDTAFVVGDPASRFRELPGAQHEARMVTGVLEKDGQFSVTSLIRPKDSRSVVSALFEKPYRILHLAGHGVYEYVSGDERSCRICGHALKDARCPEHGDCRIRSTGMVLGDGAFLTSAEIRQMREVPELVFINCCHLGRIGSGTEQWSNEHRNFNSIAASVSTEFIRMGVRAIVAAGWAVDDAAATTFAGTFYRQMLRGECFGVAVRAARQQAYEMHPLVNTWGAYQCYGDPDYCLVQRDARIKTGKQKFYVSVEEIIREIGNVAAVLSTKAAGEIAGELDELKKLTGALQTNNWFTDGRANRALARAYGEACRFAEAIDYFRRVQEYDAACMTMSDVELFANILGTFAVQLWKEQHVHVSCDRRPGRKRAHSVCPASERSMLESIGLLDWLDKMDAGGVAGGSGTVERLVLRAATYRRYARISHHPAVFLEAMSEAYSKAYKLSCKQKRADPYPLLGEFFAVLVREWFVNAQRQKGSVRRKKTNLAARLSAAKEFEGTSSIPGFRSAVIGVDRELLGALAGKTHRIADVQKLADGYKEIRKFGSPREFASVLEHIEFLETMATAADIHSIAGQLRELQRMLS